MGDLGGSSQCWADISQLKHNSLANHWRSYNLNNKFSNQHKQWLFVALEPSSLVPRQT